MGVQWANMGVMDINSQHSTARWSAALGHFHGDIEVDAKSFEEATQRIANHNASCSCGGAHIRYVGTVLPIHRLPKDVRDGSREPTELDCYEALRA